MDGGGDGVAGDGRRISGASCCLLSQYQSQPQTSIHASAYIHKRGVGVCVGKWAATSLPRAGDAPLNFFVPSIDQLSKLLVSSPDDPFLLYGLAIEHAKAGRVDVACEWFDKCLAADPAYCYAYFHKGKTQLEAGRSSDGLATLRAGLVASARHKDLKAMNELQALLDEHE